MTGSAVHENLGKNYSKQDVLDKDIWLTVHPHCSLTNNHHKDKLVTLKVLKKITENISTGFSTLC